MLNYLFKKHHIHNQPQQKIYIVKFFSSEIEKTTKPSINHGKFDLRLYRTKSSNFKKNSYEKVFVVVMLSFEPRKLYS
ncbi:MAG: hypothetical protein CUR32_01460 [Flavobacterium sp.]|nr:MAG: hypothetical protein CUR32_01460 [Flavobacterium sp.] [Flavobacterium sp. FEMGT703F]